jgi:hypothetical protein
LRLLQSNATGFPGLAISSGGRIRLTGGCSSGRATVSISDEIAATLKRLPGVRYVMIYDPASRAETPTGERDSRPFCLDP